LRAPIARVGFAAQHAKRHQLVDQLPDRLFADAGAARNFDLPRAVEINMRPKLCIRQPRLRDALLHSCDGVLIVKTRGAKQELR
jgi:hypothetical protein